MMTVEHRVGRLVELYSVAPYSLPEIQRLGAEMAVVLGRIPQKVVALVDMRRADVVPQEQVNLFVPMLRNDNPRLERSAFLIRPGAIFGMQVERIIREAGSADRRAFRDAEEALAWLAEVLAPEEVVRARAFLEEGAGWEQPDAANGAAATGGAR